MSLHVNSHFGVFALLQKLLHKGVVSSCHVTSNHQTNEFFQLKKSHIIAYQQVMDLHQQSIFFHYRNISSSRKNVLNIVSGLPEKTRLVENSPGPGWSFRFVLFNFSLKPQQAVTVHWGIGYKCKLSANPNMVLFWNVFNFFSSSSVAKKYLVFVF